jgi:AcrR family transcriptional regulator
VASKSSKNPPEKQPYHHGDLRAALMAAALKLIDRHGVKGFTLKDAARMAGVSIAAPYRHFADKEALLRAIQEEGFAAFDAALAASRNPASTPKEQLIELGLAYLRFALGHPAHIRVMFGMAGKALPPDPTELRHGQIGYALLVESVAALDPHAPEDLQHDLVVASWSIVHGYALLQLDGVLASTGSTGDPETQLRRALARLLASN